MDEISNLTEPSRDTNTLPSEGAQGFVFEKLVLLETESYGPEKVDGVVRPTTRKQFQCSIKKPTEADFVDEGYFSPSLTESDTEFFVGSVQLGDQPEIEKAPQAPRIASNDVLLQLPQLSVTDENGDTEIIAPNDDEHGQLWNFARDKIARRMFFIRADRRKEHMASTFYSDLYPVRNTLIFAHNGSLLAHAHRDECQIRLARTESATFSSAYVSYTNGHHSRTQHPGSNGNAAEASEVTDPDSIIYESRTSNHITIITPIATKVLLAVTGAMSPTTAEYLAQTDEIGEEDAAEAETEAESEAQVSSISTSSPASSPLASSPDHSSPANGLLEPPESLLEELGSISDQLSSVLREEMGSMRWPDGA